MENNTQLLGRGVVTVSATALLFMLTFSAPARATTTEQLVYRADHVLRGNTTAALLQMRVHTSTYDRTYDMVYWADERGGMPRAFVKVLGPAMWRGHGTLKVGGRLSLYDPRADRVTVLSSTMLGDNWMGSHFTNDDLVKETDLAKDYRSQLEKSWSADAGGSSVHYYRVRLDPKPSAPVAWNHIILELYEQGSDVIPTREEYYRRAAETQPTRTMTMTGVRELGGRLVPTELTVHVASKPDEFTTLTYQKLRFDADVPSSKFTEQALRQ